MISLYVRIVVGLAACAVLIGLEALGRRLGRSLLRLALGVAVGVAAIGLGYFAYIAWRQLRFPLQLEAMELTILQHAQRLAAGLPVYPRPSADFVSLAYNPGLYLLLWPALQVVPASLTLLRLPAFAASISLIGLFGYIMWRLSRSWAWTIIAAFLPVLATRSFDCNLVTGHADIVVITIALIGALVLEGERLPLSRRDRDLIATVLLVSAFWFKQNAAIMGLGVGAYFFARDGWNAWRLLGVLAMLGPVAYWFAGPPLFGPDFIESTFRVPASWSHWHLGAAGRFLRFSLAWWAVPLGAAVRAWWQAFRDRALIAQPLTFLFPFALMSGLLGALDSGSSDNVFSLAGAWMLVMLLHSIGPWLAPAATARQRRLAIGALTLTAVFMINDFRDWEPPRRAQAAYSDFASMLRRLDGPIYAPWLGCLPEAVPATARAHWVALEDRVRGGGMPGPREPVVVSLLSPVEKAAPPAYVLTATPLETDYLLGWLAADYKLETDFGARWIALRELPHRFGARYPRYLYRRVNS